MDNTADLLGIISSLGSDPSVMGAISELLKNTGNGATQSPQVQPSEPPQTANFPQFTAPSANGYAQTGQFSRPQSGNGGVAQTGISPELIGSLLSALGGTSPNGGKPNHAENGRDSADPLSKLLGGKTESENRIRLLNALRPYLNEERRSKLDLILKLLKLAELGKLSGFLNSV